MVIHSRDNSKTERDIIAQQGQDHAHPQPSDPTHPAYKPPPPGETNKTGHWHGNTWHRTVPIKSERGSSQSASGVHFDYDKESLVLARRIIKDRPYSEDALEARLFLAEWDENGDTDIPTYPARLYDALTYHPESSYLLSRVALINALESPHEAIGFAEKALKHLEDWDGAEIYGDILATAYQRLGDSKKAMMYLKKAQERVRARLPRDPNRHYDIEVDDFSYEIEALQNGTWDIQPMALGAAENPSVSSSSIRLPVHISLDKTPKEVIAYLQKTISLDVPDRLPIHDLSYAHDSLGHAYERLGDYKTAWVHYK